MTLIASKRSASSIRTIVLRNENKNRTQYSIIEHHHPSLGGRGVVGSGRKCQTACKPGSVPPEGGDGHSSGPLIAERFSRPTRTPRAGEPCTRRRATSLFGLAPGGACHAVPVARSAVGPYPTLSPLPLPKRRRFAFCGAIPRVTPGGRYPPPFRRGARTFLDAETPRPPDRLTGLRWMGSNGGSTSDDLNRPNRIAKNPSARPTTTKTRPSQASLASNNGDCLRPGVADQTVIAPRRPDTMATTITTLPHGL